jgi:hypothetical protein
MTKYELQKKGSHPPLSLFAIRHSPFPAAAVLDELSKRNRLDARGDRLSRALFAADASIYQIIPTASCSREPPTRSRPW